MHLRFRWPAVVVFLGQLTSYVFCSEELSLYCPKCCWLSVAHSACYWCCLSLAYLTVCDINQSINQWRVKSEIWYFHWVVKNLLTSENVFIVFLRLKQSVFYFDSSEQNIQFDSFCSWEMLFNLWYRSDVSSLQCLFQCCCNRVNLYFKPVTQLYAWVYGLYHSLDGVWFTLTIVSMSLLFILHFLCTMAI